MRAHLISHSVHAAHNSVPARSPTPPNFDPYLMRNLFLTSLLRLLSHITMQEAEMIRPGAITERRKLLACGGWYDPRSDQ